MLFFLMITFTYYKIDVLLQKTSVDIMSAVSLNHYDDSYIFGGK